MNMPTSWNDIQACSCPACAALTLIHNRCVETGGLLFVVDCRMWPEDRPWVLGSVDRMFVSPAPDDWKYPDRESAVAAVLAQQSHCDVFESSWPMKPNGFKDYAWRREIAA
jgi:hypothetical protein